MWRSSHQQEGSQVEIHVSKFENKNKKGSYFRKWRSDCWQSFFTVCFYWSKELLIDQPVIPHLINSWHILHCQTTKAHIMQMWSIFFVWLIRRAHSTLLLNIEAAPFLHSCLSGVFLVFLCCGMVLLPSAAGLQNAACSQASSTVSSKRSQSSSVVFHWLTVSWCLVEHFLCVLKKVMRCDTDRATPCSEKSWKCNSAYKQTLTDSWIPTRGIFVMKLLIQEPCFSYASASVSIS